jgi:uncharacterized protein (DUF1697 family)
VPAYVAFLRAINLGRTRKVPMASLREWLAEAGFTGVETYIQTGNVLVTTGMRSREKVEARLEELLAARTGFEVPTVAFTPSELTRLYAATQAVDVTAARRYLTLLKREPDPETAATLDAWRAPGEGAKVLGRAVFWWIDHPNAAARLSNAVVEKRLGVATTRDLKVMATLAERWGR